jgi:hypothetical protein
MLETEYGKKLAATRQDPHWREFFNPCLDDEKLWAKITDVVSRFIDKSLRLSHLEASQLATFIGTEMPDFGEDVRLVLPTLSKNDEARLIGMILWFHLGVDERATWVVEGRADKPKRYRLK